MTARQKCRAFFHVAREVSVCYQDADQILKGIVFSGGSRILETFPETSKEPLPKELSEDLEELEKSYKNQEFQNIEAILERLKGRLKKQKNLYWYGKCTDRIIPVFCYGAAEMKCTGPEICSIRENIVWENPLLKKFTGMYVRSGTRTDITTVIPLPAENFPMILLEEIHMDIPTGGLCLAGNIRYF